MMKMNDNPQKERNTKSEKQITNREVKTEPVVDFKPLIKHSLAGLASRVMEAPLLWLAQHPANFPTLFNEQRLEIVC